MKSRIKSLRQLICGFCFLITYVLSSCSDWTLPPELVGTWESETIEITVRTRTAEKEWVFTSDSAAISITIHADKRVNGSIGAALFEDGKIRKNPGNPEKKGLAEIIECGTIGKIFEDDPMDPKEVQLWLAPIKDGAINTELRFTTGWNQFPMAGFVLKKVDD
jgi:hypothetical protein